MLGVDEVILHPFMQFINTQHPTPITKQRTNEIRKTKKRTEKKKNVKKKKRKKREKIMKKKKQKNNKRIKRYTIK